MVQQNTADPANQSLVPSARTLPFDFGETKARV